MAIGVYVDDVCFGICLLCAETSKTVTIIKNVSNVMFTHTAFIPSSFSARAFKEISSVHFYAYVCICFIKYAIVM